MKRILIGLGARRRTWTVVACVAVMAAGCDSGDSSADELDQLRERIAELEAENEELRGGTALPTTQASTQAPVADGVEATCAYIGDDTFEDGQVELTFTNTLGDVEGLRVTYALRDGDGGTRFLTATESVTLPRTNEQFRIVADTAGAVPPAIQAATIDCTVLAIEEGFESGFERASDADTCTVLGADPYGGIQVEVAVTSPYDVTTNLTVEWALEAPGPVRIGEGTTGMDLVAAGESIRITGNARTEVPGWIGDGEVTCAVLGFRG